MGRSAKSHIFLYQRTNHHTMISFGGKKERKERTKEKEKKTSIVFEKAQTEFKESGFPWAVPASLDEDQLSTLLAGLLLNKINNHNSRCLSLLPKGDKLLDQPPSSLLMT